VLFSGIVSHGGFPACVVASHRELERRAGIVIGHGPESSAVLLDDGAADRQAHSRPSALRGVEERHVTPIFRAWTFEPRRLLDARRLPPLSERSPRDHAEQLNWVPRQQVRACEQA